jgi:soluble lytic murein transglycosylase-like protein
MADIRTKRPFQERFLDGFDRSQLRQEVQKVPPRRFKGLRKKYATWALGASLAFGGIGVPMKMMHRHEGTADDSSRGESSLPIQPQQSIDQQIVGDLVAATNIARQVAGGVEAATTSPLSAIAKAPQKLATTAVEVAKAPRLITEAVKEQFFKKEVPFGSIIYQAAQKHDVPPELVAAVVQAESRFKPTARSPVGARGLMQLMPATGKWMGARDLNNPTQNIQAGTKYLKYLNERFDGNQEKVIAAYNAGEGNVKRFGGIPPFKETRSYVTKVKNYQRDYGDRIASMQAGVAGAGAANMVQ